MHSDDPELNSLLYDVFGDNSSRELASAMALERSTEQISKFFETLELQMSLGEETAPAPTRTRAIPRNGPVGTSWPPGATLYLSRDMADDSAGHGYFRRNSDGSLTQVY